MRDKCTLIRRINVSLFWIVENTACFAKADRNLFFIFEWAWFRTDLLENKELCIGQIVSKARYSLHEQFHLKRVPSMEVHHQLISLKNLTATVSYRVVSQLIESGISSGVFFCKTADFGVEV